MNMIWRSYLNLLHAKDFLVSFDSPKRLHSEMRKRQADDLETKHRTANKVGR